MSLGMAWFDTGTHESMLRAIQFVHAIETRTGQKIASPEEIAWDYKWITDKQLQEQAHSMGKSDYGIYLQSLIKELP